MNETERRPLFDVDRAARLLQEAGMDLLLASRRQSVGYLTGVFSHIYWEYPEVAHCLEREDDGCQSPYFFAGIARKDVAGGAFVVAHENRAYVWQRESWIGDVKGCCERPRRLGTVAALLEAIRERNLTGATIGIERNHLPVSIYEELRAGLPNARFVDATPTLWELRMAKTEAELSRQREAYRLAESIYEELFHVLARERMTVAEARAFEMRRATELHCPPLHFGYVFPQDGAAKRAWVPNASEFPIEAGDVLLLDMGLIFKGYTTDFGRVATMGKVPSGVREAFRLTQENRRIMETAIRAGVRACDVYQAGAAFRNAHNLPVHPWLGHGLGIECHEPPVLCAEDQTALEEGMVIVIELADHVGGIAFLLEDAGVVTRDGWKSLTTMPTEIIEIGLSATAREGVRP